MNMRQAQWERWHLRMSVEQQREFMRAPKITHPTSIEVAVGDELRRRGEAFEFQQPFGRYVVDFFLPEREMILECDGDYWHNLAGAKESDKKRDAQLPYPVIRLTETAIHADVASAVSEVL